MSEALEILKSCDAFLEGHFLLSSGRHSSAYCQMAYLQQYPDRCAEVMKAVADKIREMDVDVIVGPAMGGIVYAYELARQTGKRAIFTERVDNVMTLKRFAIHPGEKCLIAEDVVTTGILSGDQACHRRGRRRLPGHHLRGGPHQARGSVSHPHRGQRSQAGPAQLRPRGVPHLQGGQAASGASGQPQDEAGSQADPVNAQAC